MIDRSTAVSGRSYPQLFEAGRMRDLALANRLIMAPMESNLAMPDGSVSETQLEYYRCRAAGGVGMVIVEYTCIDGPIGIGGAPQLRIDEDRLIASHADLVRTIHAGGAKACLQLFHAGRQTHPKFTEGLQSIAASPIPCPMYRKTPRQMTPDEMVSTAHKFGAAAARARAAGYDAVEIHGAHGYLLANFLSRASNKRNDAYGGCLENRQRFPLMVVKEVRRGAAGIPVLFRLTADEFVTDGIDLEEAKDTASKVVAAGVDVIHVTTGCHETIDRNVDPVWMPEGWRLPLAKAIRESVDVPVIAVGVIRQPEVAEKAIEDGSADFIALGRALLADPEWPNKVRTGRSDEIRPCTSCNWCLVQIGKGETPVGCAENPRAGHEMDPFPVHVKDRRRAVVVGSGPGGITAALTLDSAGFEVVLLEAADVLAPGLLASGAAPGKGKFLGYRDYLARRLERSSIDVRLGVEANVDMIVECDADFAIVATGASDRVLDGVEGLDQPHVRSAYDVLAGSADLATGAVVIYGAGEIGCEAAKFAAQRGCDVVLATRSCDEMAISRANKLRIYRERFVEKLKSVPNIRIELGCTLRAVSSDSAVFVRDGRELSWKADQLLLAVGRLPNDRLTRDLRERGIEAYSVGDAVEVQRIGDAVNGAYKLVVGLTRRLDPQGTEIHDLAI